MLRFAELIFYEDIPKGLILVKIDSLFKYWKYMIKFIRLHIIKKFFNNTLSNNKIFLETSRKLIKYVEKNLNKETSMLGERMPINILYKTLIGDFHQAFFIKKTMFPEYEVLREIVDDYNNTVKYINKSCSIFKPLDDKQEDSGETIDSISIQYGNKKVQDDNHNDNHNDNHMNGGKYNEKFNKQSKIILHDKYSFEDTELDNINNKFNNKTIINSKTHKYTEKENKFIITKLHKMLKDEIAFLGKLSHSISK
jgi:hypothetical protein